MSFISLILPSRRTMLCLVGTVQLLFVLWLLNIWTTPFDWIIAILIGFCTFTWASAVWLVYTINEWSGFIIACCIVYLVYWARKFTADMTNMSRQVNAIRSAQIANDNRQNNGGNQQSQSSNTATNSEQYPFTAPEDRPQGLTTEEPNRTQSSTSSEQARPRQIMRPSLTQGPVVTHTDSEGNKVQTYEDGSKVIFKPDGSVEFE